MTRATNRRPQRSKRERESVQRIQELRQGSTTDRHRSVKDYRRKPKHPGWGEFND